MSELGRLPSQYVKTLGPEVSGYNSNRIKRPLFNPFI